MLLQTGVNNVSGENQAVAGSGLRLWDKEAISQAVAREGCGPSDGQAPLTPGVKQQNSTVMDKRPPQWGGRTIHPDKDHSPRQEQYLQGPSVWDSPGPKALTFQLLGTLGN